MTYGRTALGQIVYDLGFTELSDRYLARKHGVPIAWLRVLRDTVRENLRPRKKARRCR